MIIAGCARHAEPATRSAASTPPPGSAARARLRATATQSHVDAACAAAAEAFPRLPRDDTSEQRAQFLEAIAANIEAIKRRRSSPVPCAETGLPERRITGEVGRTTGQLRLFAGVLREGRWNGARIDPAQPDRNPLPRPDIRQRTVPLGPVAVFGASNFPLAFSVARRRHRLRAGCRLPRGGQGARRAPRHLRTRRPRHHRRRHRAPACPRAPSRCCSARAGPRHRAGHRPAHQGRRIHRIPFRRNRSGRRGGRPPGAHPRVCRDELDQPGVPARRCPGAPAAPTSASAFVGVARRWGRASSAPTPAWCIAVDGPGLDDVHPPPRATRSPQAGGHPDAHPRHRRQLRQRRGPR